MNFLKSRFREIITLIQVQLLQFGKRCYSVLNPITIMGGGVPPTPLGFCLNKFKTAYTRTLTLLHFFNIIVENKLCHFLNSNNRFLQLVSSIKLVFYLYFLSRSKFGNCIKKNNFKTVYSQHFRFIKAKKEPKTIQNERVLTIVLIFEHSPIFNLFWKVLTPIHETL